MGIKRVLMLGGLVGILGLRADDKCGSERKARDTAFKHCFGARGKEFLIHPYDHETACNSCLACNKANQTLKVCAGTQKEEPCGAERTALHKAKHIVSKRRARRAVDDCMRGETAVDRLEKDDACARQVVALVQAHEQWRGAKKGMDVKQLRAVFELRKKELAACRQRYNP